MKIFKHEPYWGSILKNLPAIEDHYNGKFIAEMTIPGKSGYLNFPLAIFYQETPPQPDYSNYFGLFFDEFDRLCITGAGKFNPWVTGITCPKKHEILYSRYRHDMVTNEYGTMIDGGLDYTRSSSNGEFVKINLETGLYFKISHAVDLHKEFNNTRDFRDPESKEECDYIISRIQNVYQAEK